MPAKLSADPGKMRRFYDDRYNNGYMGIHKGLDLLRVKNMLDEVPVTISRVLDYGCGQGGWSAALSKRFPHSELCGIDISTKAIALARARHPTYEFLVFDGKAAPMADGSFDFIYSYHVLEHVSDLRKTVFDISRLLKEDGYLCVVLPCANENSFEERIARLVKNGKEPSIDGGERFFYDDTGHMRRLKSDELIELFVGHGLKLYKQLYAYHFWGAIEWISKAGIIFINEIFDSKTSISFSAKIKLLTFRTIFLPLAVLMKLYTADLQIRIRSERNAVKKMFFSALIPVKMFVFPFGKVIDLLSFLEWHFCRMARNGSAQYLIFKK